MKFFEHSAAVSAAQAVLVFRLSRATSEAEFDAVIEEYLKRPKVAQ